MRFLLNALLAATALIPAATAASAQDAPFERGGDRGDRGHREERVPLGDSDRPQRQDAPRAEAPRADATARVAAEPQRGWNRSDRGGAMRADAGVQAQAWQRQPQSLPPQVQQQQQPQVQRQWSDRRTPAFGNGQPQGARPTADDWNRQRALRSSPAFTGNVAPQPGFRDDRRPATDWNRQRVEPQRYDNRRYDNQRYDNRNGWNQPRGDQWRGGSDNGRRYDARGSWNRTWRNDRQYDWSRYRNDNRYAYRLPRYYAPSGWSYGYRRFSIGVTLSSLLWDENYWIDDPYSYRLPEAYGPYRWVRYYNDALLVDVRYGQVVDVVYDIFW